jgi:hypothetical protein
MFQYLNGPAQFELTAKPQLDDFKNRPLSPVPKRVDFGKSKNTLDERVKIRVWQIKYSMELA